jgi:uncharacterized protein (UPF0333 family)
MSSNQLKLHLAPCRQLVMFVSMVVLRLVVLWSDAGHYYIIVSATSSDKCAAEATVDATSNGYIAPSADLNRGLYDIPVRVFCATPEYGRCSVAMT